MSRFLEQGLIGFGALIFMIAVGIIVSFILPRYFNVTDNTILISGGVSIAILGAVFERWGHHRFLKTSMTILGAGFASFGIFGVVVYAATFWAGLSLGTGVLAGFAAVFLSIVWLLSLWAKADIQSKKQNP